MWLCSGRRWSGGVPDMWLVKKTATSMENCDLSVYAHYFLIFLNYPHPDWPNAPWGAVQRRAVALQLRAPPIPLVIK